MELLLLSNSTTHGYGYLEHALDDIKSYFGDVKEVLFIPYAGVSISYNDYTQKVAEKFKQIGIDLISIHTLNNSKAAVENFKGIAVGGGNTFRLLQCLYDYDLLETIRNHVKSGGAKYIGWSAGSNMACPTIKTTNDMPIAEPKSFTALNLVDYQINPHFIDVKIENHNGETRTQRIEEFLEINPDIYVIGLREGSMIEVKDGTHTLKGDKQALIFKKSMTPYEINPGLISLE